MIPDIKNENDLRKLAGLPIKEAGESLDNIIAKHRETFESVMRGESSLYDHDEFYDDLYEYYVSSGEMPYGIAKARDGDPDQWIQEELDREYGDDFATDDVPDSMDGDFDSGMASAGMGTDEDYGYYGEGKEPKTFKEHLQAVQEGGIRLLPPDPNDPMKDIWAGGKDAIKKAHKDKKIGYKKGDVDPRLAKAAKKRYTDVGVYHDDR